ncbi:eukaryotic protein [Schizosaccharomyces cryophilus OY26]|uniref:MICOS complex subunit MIC10 n=1 Tax=Schizosaccharomyces cryophilus (strain OY26 / ATCC MYA-4695 / CBS 11777 / NBRC 106824 / NRRL Y48691) TaxID=653667 RepID=S9VQG9_SCHCR|nr:uncharacterized protein SPOG_00969 [Schizosaccharomyces cryophilus OY26]EPY50208.1 eukaryotic protein [Schizosaccharomyces cryophilus OY26]
MSKPVSSEQTLNYKWDVCLSNMFVQSTLGLGIGIISSAIMFRRAAWPVWGGLGFGLGKAYADCNAKLKTFPPIPRELSPNDTQGKN